MVAFFLLVCRFSNFWELNYLGMAREYICFECNSMQRPRTGDVERLLDNENAGKDGRRYHTFV